jgi:hypothetical protein
VNIEFKKEKENWYRFMMWMIGIVAWKDYVEWR